MSTTSDQIKEWFLNSLTARAAYGYFTGDPPGTYEGRLWGERELGLIQVLLALKAEDRQVKFTNEMAAYFVSHYAVVEHNPNSSHGYSATIFGRRAVPIPILANGTSLATVDPTAAQQEYLEYVFAQRGTETVSGTIQDDLFDADRGIAFSGGPHTQRAEMNNFWRGLIADDPIGPLADVPDIRAALAAHGAVATGHSLGAALATAFMLDNESSFQAGYTFNGAGLEPSDLKYPGHLPTGLSSKILEKFFGLSPNFFHERMVNVFAEIGREFTTGVNSVWGDIQPIATENVGGLLGDGWHAMLHLTDALSVYYLLSQLDPSLQVPQLANIIRAFGVNDQKLEPFARWLAGVFNDSGPVGEQGQSEIFKRINWMESEQAAGTLPVFKVWSLASSSADEIVSLASLTSEAGAAVRDALVRGSPIAITGGDLNFSGRNDLAIANFSLMYLQERADFLVNLMAANSADAVQFGGIRVSGLGADYYAEAISGIEDDAAPTTIRVASDFPLATTINSGVVTDLTRHLFGNVGDDTLTGQTGDDKLFGGAGNDTLEGGAGNDYLDGGAGTDVLCGGAGYNTLDGGPGNDGYEVALGANHTTILTSESGDRIYLELAGNGLTPLGSGLVATPGSPYLATDSFGNTYRVSGLTLSITTKDGREITAEQYNSGDFGITMPSAQPIPTVPVVEQYALYHAAPTGWDSETGIWQVPGGRTSQGYVSGLRDPASGYKEWLDLRNFQFSWSGNFYSAGAFGDSYIYGRTTMSNVMIDDTNDLWDANYSYTPIADLVGNDFLAGGPLNDYILTHGGDDVARGGGGTDFIVDRPEGWAEFGTVAWVNTPGHSNRDQLYGEDGNDFISANAGDGFLDGGDGGDVLFGGAGHDILLGGAGNDLLSGDTKDKNILVGLSPDLAFYNADATTNDLQYYDADFLDGGDGNDELIGGGGSDTLFGGAGNDILQGDLVILNAPGSWTWENAPAGNATNFNFATILTAHVFDPDSIHGNDVLYGDAGDDFLFGGGLADELHGGDGNDVIYGENQEQGTAAEAAIALQYHGNDLIFGDGGNDTIYGNGGGDIIDGGDGDDVIVGDAYDNLAEIGNDELHGGAGIDLIVGRGGDDRIFGDAGNDDLQGEEGNDTIEGGDGDDNILGGSGNDTLEGGAGADAIGGEDGDDTLISAAGGDSLFGGAGNDTYVMRIGSGATYVSDGSGASVIRFEGGIHQSDLRMEVSTVNGGPAVRLYYSGSDYVFMEAGGLDRISRFEFSDGATLTGSDLFLSYQPPTTNVGDHQVHLNVDSSLVALNAVGQDLILRYAGANPDWVNTADLTSKHILWATGLASDYGLGTGKVLVLRNWYTSELGSSISGLQGASGDFVDLGLAAWNLPRTQQTTAALPYATGNYGADTLLGSAGTDALAGGGGNDTLDGGAGSDFLTGEDGDDTYVVRPGSGIDWLTETSGTDTIRFDNGLLSTDVVFHQTSEGLEVVVGAAADNNRLVILGWFDSADRKVEQFSFTGDGVVWTAAQVESRISGNLRPTLGTPLTDATLNVGTAFSFTIPGNAFVDPNADDTLTLDAFVGENFGVLPAWLTFNPTTRTFSGTAPAAAGNIDIIVVATDSGGLEASDTFSLSYTPSTIFGTPGDDDGWMGPSLNGTAFGERIEGLAGNDLIHGNGGDDVLVGGPGDDLLTGGAGNDTYVYNRGDGDDSIGVSGGVAGEIETLAFGSGFSASDLVFSTNSSGTVQIQLREPGGAVGDSGIQLEFYQLPQYAAYGISRITFADHPDQTLTRAQLDALINTPTENDDYLRGTSGNDTIVALGGSDVINGLAGNDTIDAGAGNNNVVAGGAGNDTYLVNRNGGAQTIWSTDALSTDMDTLRFGAGILPGDVRVTRSVGLVVSVAASGTAASAQVTIRDEDNSTLSGSNIDRIEFADAPGTVWSTADLRRISLIGTNAAESLSGYASDDVLRGNGGNDLLFGGAGADTYEFGTGSGNDTAQDVSGANRIKLDAGLLPANVTLYRTSSRSVTQQDSGADSLVLVLNGGADQFWLEGYFASPPSGLLSALQFGDGTVWNESTILANVVNLAGTANTLAGTSGDDSFTVDHRNDIVNEAANGGVDTVTSSVSNQLNTNVENLTLAGLLNLYGIGNAGVNTLRGNAGANYLYGGSSPGNGGRDLNADTLIGGNGDDLYDIRGSGGAQGYEDIVVEDPNGGYDTIKADSYLALMPDNVEALIVTGRSGVNTGIAMRYVGNALNNLIDASAVNAYGAGFTIDGGLGADTMIGPSSYSFAASTDRTIRFIVDDPGDVVISAATGAFEAVRSSISYVLPDSIETLELSASNTISGTGNSRNNTLNGSLNAGANVLTGGSGDDTYILGAGDTFVELAGQGNDVVQLTSVVAGTVYSVAGYANIEGISVTGTIGAVSLLGDGNNNALTGNSSANTLTGGAGNDTLVGDAGNDTYDGFTLTSGNDVIVDTSGSTDTIRFDSTANVQASQLDLNRDGNDVLIAVGAQSSIRLQGFFASTDNRLESLRLFDQGLEFSYNANEILSSAQGVNVGPRANTVGTTSVVTGIGQLFSYQLEANYFLDLDSQQSLTYAATLSTGGALPGWLSFNSVTRTFSGTPTGNDNLTLSVIATDAGGLSTTRTFSIAVQVVPIQGTSGNDVLNGSSGEDEIYGLGGNDTLNGLGGSDYIEGGDGNDILDGGAGDDSLYGGLGDDTYYVDSAGDEATENPGEGTDEVRSSVTYTLTPDIERLLLLGTSAIDGTGNSGNNVLTGNSAVNVLSGGAGNDTLDGGGGADSMSGGQGNDTFVVDNAGDVTTEAASQGTDLVQSSVTIAALAANVENLTLTGAVAINGSGNTLSNVIVGNGANNTLNAGTAGTDTLQGGAGDDIYVVDHTGVTVTENASEGTDLVQSTVAFTLGTNVENLTLTGSAAVNGTGNSANNILIGNSGSNTLSGGGGADTLDGGSAGTDILQGQAGDDTYIVTRTSGITVTEVASEGTDLVQASVTHTLAANVENLTLTGTSAINGTGNTANNIVTGNSGVNTLNGGTAGTDTLLGGAGDDIYVVDHTGVTVTESASEGTDLVQSTVAFTLGNNVENLTLTGTSAVNGTGNTLDNLIVGNTGNNTLAGGGGNDSLNAGTAGTDVLQGNAGNDIYVVDHATVTVTEAANEGTDLVQSTVAFTLGSNVENLTLTGSGAVNGTGNTLDNVLIGNSGNNTLTGSDGNDTLDGGSAGTDALLGGIGNDTYVVGRTTGITITENASQGTDTVQSSVAYTLGTNLENLTLTGSGAVSGTGNTSNNVITGNSGANTLDGGSGDDTLAGGGGADSLTGGLGADIYQYTTGGGADTINNVAADSLIDRLQFTDLALNQVTFSKSGTNLVMTRVGVGTDTVTVTNWFSATANRLDFVSFTNGEKTAAQIDALFASGGTGGVFTSVVARPVAMGMGGVPELRALTLLGVGPDPAQTLGAKMAAEDARTPKWQPIKTFPASEASDATAVGVTRLVEAMTLFGVERSVDLANDTIGSHAGSLEQLAAHHESPRTQVLRTAIHEMFDAR